MDLQERAFHLTLKWLESHDSAKNLSPAQYTDKYMLAYQDIVRVLIDNEPPESINAESIMAGLRDRADASK